MIKSSIFDEAALNKSEDAPPLVRDGLIAVADGLGGRGVYPVEYADGSVTTHAHAASRLCLEALDALCTDGFADALFEALDAADARAASGAPEADAPDEGAVLSGLALGAAEAIRAHMTEWLDGRNTGDIPEGFHVLPTTLAAMLLRDCGEYVDVAALWSGDSRCYVLTVDGLCQLTTDDLMDGPDYQSLLEQDTVMTNHINLSTGFYVSSRRCKVPKPCVLFAATDGCFMYLPSFRPCALRFEYQLLRLLRDRDMDSGVAKLAAYLFKCAQDDVSMAIGAFADDGYAGIRGMLNRRYDRFMELYGDAWRVLSAEDFRPGVRKKLEKKCDRERAEYREELRGRLEELLIDGSVFSGNAIADEISRKLDARAAELRAHRAVLENGRTAAVKAFADALLDCWADVKEIRYLPYDASDILRAGDAKQEEKLAKLIEKNSESLRFERGERDRLRKSHYGVYVALLDAVNGVERMFEDSWRDSLEALRADMNALARYMDGKGEAAKLKKLMEQSERVVEAERRHEVLRGKLRELAGDRPLRLAEVILANGKSCNRICAQMAELKPLCDEYEAKAAGLADFDEHCSMDINNAKRQLIDDAVSSPGELLDWLEERGYDSGPCAQSWFEAQRTLSALDAKLALFDRQWAAYKPGYEKLMQLPAHKSAAVLRA